MRIGGRRIGSVVRAPFAVGHWRALAGMPQVYPRRLWRDVAERYLLARGDWPWRCRVRTPLGPVDVVLDTRDDLLTVNEVFARRDYAAPPDLRVAVDVGANIGLATLYFLTRNHQARSYLVEPDPKNVARLPRTLAGFEGRWSVQEVAAASHDGEAPFYVEPTGRYGGLFRERQQEQITVRTRAFGDLVDEVLEREDRIDVLKIDTEGTEEQLVASLRPDHLDRISRIYYESDDPTPLHLDRYRHAFTCQTNALVRHG